MPKFKVVEMTTAEVAKEQAEILSSLMENLKRKGIKDEVAERLAASVAGAASSWLDGCKGMENPIESVVNPVLRTTTAPR